MRFSLFVNIIQCLRLRSWRGHVFILGVGLSMHINIICKVDKKCWHYRIKDLQLCVSNYIFCLFIFGGTGVVIGVLGMQGGYGVIVWHGLVIMYIVGNFWEKDSESEVLAHVANVDKWDNNSLCICHTVSSCVVVQMLLRVVCMHMESRWRHVSVSCSGHTLQKGEGNWVG